MAGGEFERGHERVKAREKDNYSLGRSGGETMKKPGPVKSMAHNPTAGGLINRAARGTGSGKKS